MRSHSRTKSTNNENLLLFDNNVYRKIIKHNKTTAEQEYVHGVNATIMGLHEGTFTRIMTPFGAMEALGVTIKAKPPSSKFPAKSDIAQRISQALGESIDFFASQDYLSPSALINKLQEQLGYSDSDSGIREFLENTLVRTVKAEGFADTLHSWLGFDHLLQISNWGFDSVQVNSKIVLETFRALAHDRDLPLFRLMYRAFADIEEQLRKQGKKVLRPFRLESREDYLDTDIIHYPIMGLVNRPRVRVTVVTEENYAEIHNRLVWAKMAYRHWISIIDPALAKFPVPRPVYGDVLILNREDGTLEKRIKAKKLKEGLYLIDDGKIAA